MRAHYLEHVACEGLGCIEPWLTSAGYSVSATRLHAEETFPSPDSIDWLVIMGGPMSVNDDATLPWLAPEKAFVRACIDRGLPVLGVCLGAQMIAHVLGARVYRNTEREIGWFPVTADPDAPRTTFQFPAETTVFHWHGETFDLPSGAQRLARSEACLNQAFQWGRSVIGLQFHIEATPQSVRDLVEADGHELTGGPFVQSAQEILDAPPERFRDMNELMGQILAFLHESTRLEER